MKRTRKAAEKATDAEGAHCHASSTLSQASQDDSERQRCFLEKKKLQQREIRAKKKLYVSNLELRVKELEAQLNEKDERIRELMSRAHECKFTSFSELV